MLAMAMIAVNAFALDASTIRSIERAKTPDKLISAAEDVIKSATSVTNDDYEAAMLAKQDTVIYLEYIRLRLDAMNGAAADARMQELIDLQGPD